MFHSLLFSFYASIHHRDLHSFPTRRSSDLGRSYEYNCCAPENMNMRESGFPAAACRSSALPRVLAVVIYIWAQPSSCRPTDRLDLDLHREKNINAQPLSVCLVQS